MVLALLGVSMIYYFGWKGYTPEQMRQHLADFFGVTVTPQASNGDLGTVNAPNGNITVPLPGGSSVSVDNDCSLKPGDTKVGPFIWRPIGTGALGVINGKLIGPCV